MPKCVCTEEQSCKMKQILEKPKGKIDKFSYIQGLQHLTAIKHLTGKTKRYIKYKRIYIHISKDTKKPEHHQPTGSDIHRPLAFVNTIHIPFKIPWRSPQDRTIP